MMFFFYDKIIKAAKNKDTVSLAGIIRDGACIDENKKGTNWVTPACELASQGKKKAAELLRNDFGANVNYIAAGAASGGYMKYAKTLCERHGANIVFVAAGAAAGGHEQHAKGFRKKHKICVNEIAKFAATNGNIKYAEKLRVKCGANVNEIAMGAAANGQNESKRYIEKLKQYGAIPDYIAMGAAVRGDLSYAISFSNTPILSDIILIAASGGNFESAEEFFKKTNKPKLKINIVYGAAQGGFKKYLYKMINSDKSLQREILTIALHAAIGGHKKLAEELCKNDSLATFYLCKGAAEGGHINDVENIQENNKKVFDDFKNFIGQSIAQHSHWQHIEGFRIKNSCSLKTIAEYAAKGGNREYVEHLYVKHGAQIEDIAKGAVEDLKNKELALHYLSFIKNGRYREALGKELRTKHKQHHITDELINKAKLINKLMKERNFNYDQAYIWTNSDLQNFASTHPYAWFGAKNLPTDLYFEIANCYTPFSEPETFKMLSKIMFSRNKKFLINELITHCATLLTNNSLDDKTTMRAYNHLAKLRHQLQRCNNPKEVVELLKSFMERTGMKEALNNHSQKNKKIGEFERHSKRFEYIR